MKTPASGVDIVGSRAAAGDDVERPRHGFDRIACVADALHRLQRFLLAPGAVFDVLKVAGVALQPAQDEGGPGLDLLGKRHGTGDGGNARAVAPDAEVDDHLHGLGPLRRQRDEKVDRLAVVDHEDQLLGHVVERQHALQLVGGDDGRRDEDAGDTAPNHGGGLAEFGDADADGACRHLTSGDLGALVGLGMGADALGPVSEVRRHGAEIVLEPVEVQHQRRRREARAGATGADQVFVGPETRHGTLLVPRSPPRRCGLPSALNGPPARGRAGAQRASPRRPARRRRGNGTSRIRPRRGRSAG